MRNLPLTLPTTEALQEYIDGQTIRLTKRRPATQSQSCSEPLRAVDACRTMDPTLLERRKQNALLDPLELIREAGNGKLHWVVTPTPLELVVITLF
jgi:hypothetical protein